MTAEGAPAGGQISEADPRVATPARPTVLGRFFAHTFESLGQRYFRFLWLGSLLGMGGFQMQMIARTILVDDLTGSAFLTGLVGMGFAPSMLVLSLFGGVAGDRLERRSLIQVMQLANALSALIVGVLITTGAVHWVHLLIVSVVQGGLFAFQMPARQAVIPRLVGKQRLTNAMALNSAGMSLMAIIAPGLAGVLYGQLGPEAVYFFIFGMSLLSAVATGQLPRLPPEAGAGSRKVLQNIAEGLRYVRTNRVVLLLLASGMAVAVLAMPFRMQLPVFARRLYGVEKVLEGGSPTFFLEPSQIGWLLALAGVGGLIGTVFIANLRPGQRRGPILLAGALISGAALLLIGGFPVYAVGLTAMLAVGLAEAIRMTLGMALTLEATEGEYRARVSSLYMMTFGVMPLGALPLGKAVDAFGARPSLLVLAVIVTAVGLLFLLARPLRRLM